MNSLPLEGGAGGGLHLGNRGNNPNNNTENENKKATPAATSSPTGKDDDASSPLPVSSMLSNTAATNLLTSTAAMSNLFLSSPSSSSSPVTLSSTTTGIVMENGSCQNNKNEEATAPSSSRTTLSGEVEAEIAAAEKCSTTTPRCEREECPICFHVLPHAIDEIVYQTCCGRKICNGCIIGRQRAELKETGMIIEGVTPEEKQFILIRLFWSNLCPFCRQPGPKNDEEQLQLIYDRIEIRNDRDYTIALTKLGYFYENGECGLPQNLTKAVELYKKAYDLGDPDAAWNLYHMYHQHYPDQKEKQIEILRRGKHLGT